MPRAASASSTWATPTRPRRRRSPPDRSTWRWATSTRRRRCRARRSPRSTPARCWRSTSARPASRSGSSIVDAEPGRLAVAETRPAAGRPPPGPRHRHMGRDRGAGRRAGRRVPRPHGEDQRHRHDARRARARGVPVPGAACARNGRLGAERERDRRRTAGPGRSCTPSTTGGSTGEDAARRAARALPRRARGGGRCDRLSSRSRGSAPTGERVTFDWRGRRLVGIVGSDRLGEVLDHSMRCRSRCTARRRRWRAPRSR